MIKVGIPDNCRTHSERAAYHFQQRMQVKDLEIEYLLSTENVLAALNDGQIDFGVIAIDSSIKLRKYNIIDRCWLPVEQQQIEFAWVGRCHEG